MAMMLGTVSGVLFALGMCMVLIPAWDAFVPGLVCGTAGLSLGLVTLLTWRRMTHRKRLHPSARSALIALDGIAGALLLGVGMCCCMVWAQLVPGVLLGVAGILLLLGLIPLIRGLRA